MWLRAAALKSATCWATPAQLHVTRTFRPYICTHCTSAFAITCYSADCPSPEARATLLTCSSADDNTMPLRQRLENLPVGQKLLAALLVLLATVLLVANLTFISAAYWISHESTAPQALQTLGQLASKPDLVANALDSEQSAQALLNEMGSYAPLRAAAIYDGAGNLLAHLQHGEHLALPKRYHQIEAWRLTELRSNQLTRLPHRDGPPGHLLLIASSELPMAFYTGTFTASLGILIFSALLWFVVARQIKRHG